MNHLYYFILAFPDTKRDVKTKTELRLRIFVLSLNKVEYFYFGVSYFMQITLGVVILNIFCVTIILAVSTIFRQ